MDPEATGYENIFLRGLILGMSKKEIREQTEEIAAFTGLGEYLAMPVRTYSSGMALRLAFAVTLALGAISSADRAASVAPIRSRMSPSM